MCVVRIEYNGDRKEKKNNGLTNYIKHVLKMPYELNENF